MDWSLPAGTRPGAEETIDDALRAGFEAITLLDELIAPVMQDVGRLWDTGAIGVADEHLSTVIAHGTLTRTYPKLVAAEPRTRGRVLLAGADAEQHILGLRIVADVLEGNGFEVRNTGASLPPDSLAGAVVRHRPVLLGLGQVCGSAREALAAADRLLGPLP
jgi:methanogenic corrinoid protein MtbC1